MIEWLRGDDNGLPVDAKALSIDTVNEQVALSLDPEFVKLALDRGVSITRPCSQSVLFVSTATPVVVFIIRSCPLMDLEKKAITKYVIKARKLTQPQTVDTSVFLKWVETFGITAHINKYDTVLDLSVNPRDREIHRFDDASKRFIETTHRLTVRMHLLQCKQVSLSVPVLGIASEFTTVVK